MQNTKIKAIIFDVDGAIFQSLGENGCYLSNRSIKTDVGLTSKHFSGIFSDKWESIIRGKINMST